MSIQKERSNIYNLRKCQDPTIILNRDTAKRKNNEIVTAKKFFFQVFPNNFKNHHENQKVTFLTHQVNPKCFQKKVYNSKFVYGQKKKNTT